jgi:hypothetical protein
VFSYQLNIRAEWFLSWSQISKMAGSRSNDIGTNRNYSKFQVIWTTFDSAPKALKLEIFSAKNQFAANEILKGPNYREPCANAKENL